MNEKESVFMKIYSTSLFLILLSLSFVFSSCVSTGKVDNDNVEAKIEIEEQNDEGAFSEIFIEEKKEPEKIPTAEELFIESLNDVTVSVVSSPKVATKNRAFASAFEFQILKEGNPVSEFAVTLEYPESKNAEGEVTFAKKTFLTDEKGKVVFAPGKPTFACASKVTVYPTPLNDEKSVLQAVDAKKVSAEWLVRSDIISKGAVLFVWDYSEKNRPVNNSYEILSEFRKRGMTMVGNAPVNDSSYIGRSLDFLWKENYEIIEDSYGYLICGTVKFVKPVEPGEQGFTCSLISEIQGVDMKNGKLIFSKTFTREANGKNWNDCVSKCKSQLAQKIIDEIIYGL